MGFIFLWLILLNLDPFMLLQMIRLLFHDWIIFHFVCVCVCMRITHLYPFINGQIGCFYILAVVHYITMNTGYSNFNFVFLFPLGKYPKVKLLNHMVVIFLIFWKNTIPFPIVNEPLYYPLTVHKNFQFLPILFNTCYFLFIW